MNQKHVFLTALLLLPALMVFGQKIKVTDGDLKFLKGQKNINIEYDYSNMAVGKFDREQDYVDEKVANLNEKEAGKGDTWKEAWIADRAERFEPRFEELINKYTSNSGVNIGDNPDAEYTMILKTTFTEPGFNVGVVRKSAFTNLEAVFVKTGTNDPLAVISIMKSPGRDAMGYDFDTGLRIQESYAKAGKSLGKFLESKAF